MLYHRILNTAAAYPFIKTRKQHWGNKRLRIGRWQRLIVSTAQCQISDCCCFTDDVGGEAEKAKNYIQYPVINHNGKEYEKTCVCMCACVCVYIYIYMNEWIWIYSYIWLNIWMNHTHTHTHMNAWLCCTPETDTRVPKGSDQPPSAWQPYL